MKTEVEQQQIFLQLVAQTFADWLQSPLEYVLEREFSKLPDPTYYSFVPSCNEYAMVIYLQYGESRQQIACANFSVKMLHVLQCSETNRILRGASNHASRLLQPFFKKAGWKVMNTEHVH